MRKLAILARRVSCRGLKQLIRGQRFVDEERCCDRACEVIDLIHPRPDTHSSWAVRREWDRSIRLERTVHVHAIRCAVVRLRHCIPPTQVMLLITGRQGSRASRAFLESIDIPSLPNDAHLV